MAAPQAPKVQSISQLMTDLAPGYNEQAGVLNEQIETVGQEFEAQRQSLGAIKDQQFNKINDQAVGRGAAFSGVPLHEQADYLSTHYLPGMQASYAQENQQRLSLKGMLAQLRTEQRNRAFDTRQTQMGWLNNWNMNERGIQATAQENKLNRAFQRDERIAGQQFTAGENALNRSHQSSMQASSMAASQGPDVASIVGSIDSFLKAGMGSDKKVSPVRFQEARAKWVAAGGDPSAFAQTFSGYVNNAHRGDYY